MIEIPLRRCVMPGKVLTAYDLRYRRAFQMLRNGYTPIPTGEIGEFKVPSATNGKRYTVNVDVDGDTLVSAHCTCPDWANMDEALTECTEHPRPGFPMGIHPGVAHIDGSPVCKHIGLVLMSVGFLELPVYTLKLTREEMVAV
jgi:hypothetical protein